MAGEKNGMQSVEKLLALHEAIQLAGDESSGRPQEAQGMKRATPDQASQLASWLAERYFKDAFEVLVDKAEREAKGETYQTLYKERINAMQVYTEALFASPNFHQVNLCDRDEAKRVVRQLVRLDRLPKTNTLEELPLAGRCEYDVCMRLATRYKRLSKPSLAAAPRGVGGRSGGRSPRRYHHLRDRLQRKQHRRRRRQCK